MENLSKAFEVYQSATNELLDFLSTVFGTDPRNELGQIITSFDDLFKEWGNNNVAILGNNPSEELLRFSKAFNKFYHTSINNVKKGTIAGLLSEEAFGISKHQQVVVRQGIIMTTTALETFLEQRFQSLLQDNFNFYFKNKNRIDNISKDRKAKVFDLLVESNFNEKEAIEKLIDDGFIRYNFQNTGSIKENFRYFGVDFNEIDELDQYFNLRHILVHKYNKIDKKFIESCANLVQNNKIYIKDQWIVGIHFSCLMDYLKISLRIATNFESMLTQKFKDKSESI